ncbi:hypothetical protein G7K71_14020 [Desulfofundulus sp. TPOSR]|uniref:SAF domain-containing protein n=1 Tax=Desulfofundulus sp. TPOSR TaxID=2714340 RepID=UPI0014082AD4|nr:SAF domain-containing protein [Desulfofundulus sp. TPOSR]NHM28075.1 hypothetical protein [Desulfofundulus sp. TPOSR]
MFFRRKKRNAEVTPLPDGMVLETKTMGEKADFGSTVKERTNEQGAAGDRKLGFRVRAALLLSILAGASVFFLYTFTYRPVGVVVAVRDISPGTEITAADVVVKKVSAGDRHPEAYTSATQVIGKRAQETIHKGVQVIAPQVEGNAAGLVKSGQTVLPLKNPVAPALSAGNTVTVVAVMNEGPLVLGQATVISAPPSRPNEDRMVLLAVPSGDAPRMAYAAQSGKAVYLFVQ